MKLILSFCLALLAGSAMAEDKTYGAVYLSGLAKDSWAYNPAGVSSTMVCNVNGPDGFLSIRSGPSTDAGINRKLSRLAIVDVDTRARQGRWVKVVTAYRDTDKNGKNLSKRKSLHVTGWAHDGYLCDFIH